MGFYCKISCLVGRPMSVTVTSNESEGASTKQVFHSKSHEPGDSMNSMGIDSTPQLRQNIEDETSRGFSKWFKNVRRWLKRKRRRISTANPSDFSFDREVAHFAGETTKREMSLRVGRFYVTRTESVLTSPNSSDSSSTTKFDDFATKDFVHSKAKEAGENSESENETANDVPISRRKFRKCWDGLKRFKSFFKRYSTNGKADTISNDDPDSAKRTSKRLTRGTFLKSLFNFRRSERNIRVADSTENLTIEEKIEEIEMKTLQTSLPRNEKATSWDKKTSYDEKKIADHATSFDEKKSSDIATSTDFLASTSFKNLKPLMSPVRQKKLIACAKIEKLKNSIQRTWETNNNLDEAKANFIRKKLGKRMVHFADPVVSATFKAEEESEISLNQRIKIFLDDTQNLEPEVESSEDDEHLPQKEKENLVPDAEVIENTEHLQDEITSAEKMQMDPAVNDKPELLTGMKKWYVRRVKGMPLNDFKQVREFSTPLTF